MPASNGEAALCDRRRARIGRARTRPEAIVSAVGGTVRAPEPWFRCETLASLLIRLNCSWPAVAGGGAAAGIDPQKTCDL